MAAAEWRAQRDAELTMVRAWQMAALTGSAMAGKLPKLETLLKQMQPRSTRLSLEHITRTVGVPMRPASPEALAALERLKVRTAAHG